MSKSTARANSRMVLSTLSIIVSFLLILNLYLAAWLLSASRQRDKTTQETSSSSSNTSKRVRFKLVEARDSASSVAVKLDLGSLISKQQVHFASLASKSKQLRIESSSAPIRFRLQDKSRSNDDEILEVSPSEGALKFARGLRVVEAGHRTARSRPALSCWPREAPESHKSGETLVAGCQVGEQRLISFSNRRGVEMPTASAASLLVERVHSATNRLILQSSDATELSSAVGPVTVQSLAQLQLASLKSNVSCRRL